jgi:hypothetical protein
MRPDKHGLENIFAPILDRCRLVDRVVEPGEATYFNVQWADIGYGCAF